MDACLYSSDLNDDEWALLDPLIARRHRPGLEIIHPAALVDRRRLGTGRRGAADAPERLSGARTTMGGGANDRLAHHQSSARQGL